MYGKVMGYHHLFGMNFDPAFDLQRVWPERLDPAEKSGGGEMTNMGCYAIDFAVALLGRPRAATAKWRETIGVRQPGANGRFLFPSFPRLSCLKPFIQREFSRLPCRLLPPCEGRVSYSPGAMLANGLGRIVHE
jgi:hypothetical protein